MRPAHSLPHAFMCDVDMVHVCGARRRAASAGWLSTRVGRCWRPCPRRAGRLTSTRSRPCLKTGVAPCTISSPRPAWHGVAFMPAVVFSIQQRGHGQAVVGGAAFVYPQPRPDKRNDTGTAMLLKSRGSSSCRSWTTNELRLPDAGHQLQRGQPMGGLHDDTWHNAHLCDMPVGRGCHPQHAPPRRRGEHEGIPCHAANWIHAASPSPAAYALPYVETTTHPAGVRERGRRCLCDGAVCPPGRRGGGGAHPPVAACNPGDAHPGRSGIHRPRAHARRVWRDVDTRDRSSTSRRW
jgi:hypothetical protein